MFATQASDICLHIKVLGADYTSDFVCNFMCDLVQITDAIWCICDLVSDTELLLFTRSMRHWVAIWFAISCCPHCASYSGHEIAHNIAHKIVSAIWKKIYTKWFLSDTKLHLWFAANYTWNRTRNRSCIQPLSKRAEQHISHNSV
jgi:hypothetical protein